MLQSKVVLSEYDITSQITYQITVYNSTDYDYGYNGTVYDSEYYDNDTIGYTISGINVGDILPAKSSLSFTITFNYKTDTITNNVLNSYINFIFKRIYTVTYENITNNNYPNIALDGTSLIIELKDPIPSSITIYMSDVKIENYTYENGILTIPNVKGNIRILGINTDDYEYIIEDGTTSLNNPDISETSPVQVGDFLNMEFKGINTSSQTISTVNMLITYTSSTGAAQSISITINVTGQEYTKTVTFKGKTTETITLTFDNLNIPPTTEFTIVNSNAGIKNGNVRISKQELKFIYS